MFKDMPNNFIGTHSKIISEKKKRERVQHKFPIMYGLGPLCNHIYHNWIYKFCPVDTNLYVMEINTRLSKMKSLPPHIEQNLFRHCADVQPHKRHHLQLGNSHLTF